MAVRERECDCPERGARGTVGSGGICMYIDVLYSSYQSRGIGEEKA